MVTRLLLGSRPWPMIFSPLIRLSGQSRSQETKWFSVSQRLISYPASLKIVVAVTMSIPSIRVRSVPVMRNNSARKSNWGLFPYFFRSRVFRFSSGRGGAVAPVLSLQEIMLKLSIALRYLLLAKFVTLLFLLQHKVLRLGHKKTIGAIAHRLCQLIWMILHQGVRYEERGPAVSQPVPPC